MQQHRTGRLVAGGGLVLLLLPTACGTSGENSGSSRKGVVHSSELPLPSANPLPQSTSAPPQYRRGLPWHLARVADDQRSVFVTVSFGGCDGLPRVTQVVQKPTSVTITLWSSRPPANAVCVERKLTGQIRVDLPSPLGRRRLLHGPAGDH
jgi:hypothetical protein